MLLEKDNYTIRVQKLTGLSAFFSLLAVNIFYVACTYLRTYIQALGI